MARADAVAAGAVLVLAAVALRQAGQLPFGTIRDPGPGFLPWCTGMTLGLLAVVLLAQALAARPLAPAVGRGRRVRRVAWLVGALGAYVASLEPLGYALSTFLLVLFLLRVVDPHRWMLALGVAAVAAVGSYLVFALWLGVPLPPGLSLR
jgi:putative tricarboxylic transport membrane protein